MRDFKEKRRFRRVFFSWPLLLALLLINVLLARSLFVLHPKQKFARDGRREAEREYNDLALRKAELDSLVSELSTPRGADLELRRRFPIIKPGEDLVVIVGGTATTADEAQGGERQPGIWANLKNWLAF